MKSNLIKVVQETARRLGYEIVPKWRFEKLDQSSTLQELFRRLKIECVLDVGANKGQFVGYLRHHLNYHGKVVSFEPISENIKFLQNEAGKTENWVVCGVALGTEQAFQDINVMKADVFSSFLKPTEENTNEFAVHNVIEHVERVEIRRLDQMLKSLSIDVEKTATCLKSDTQGFDMQVLDGAGDCLRDIRIVQVEVSLIGIYDGMPGMMEMIDRMRREGFSLVGLYPISSTSELSVVEFDAIFKNDRFSLA